jgi:hypothetical protein
LAQRPEELTGATVGGAETEHFVTVTANVTVPVPLEKRCHGFPSTKVVLDDYPARRLGPIDALEHIQFRTLNVDHEECVAGCRSTVRENHVG